MGRCIVKCLLRDMHLEDSGQMREKGGKVHSVRFLERHAFGGQWTDERERLSHNLCLYFLTVGDRWKYLRVTSNG